MNLPNTLTILRIVLTFAFMLFLFSAGLLWKILALFTFLIASATDALDGFLAKRNNQITDFGKLMDPIADKILVLAAFLAFVEMGIVPAWMVVIIISREAVITGLRILALTKGKVIASEDYGKHKMVSQVLAIFIILLYIIFDDGGPAVFGFWTVGVSGLFTDTIYVLMLIVIALTLISGFSYLTKNKGVYSDEKKN